MGSFHLWPLDGAKYTQMNSQERLREAINEAINGFSGHRQTSNNSRLNYPDMSLFICCAA